METPIQNAEEIEKELKDQKIRMARSIFHLGTKSHGNKLRGVGITRKNKEETKKAKKLAKSQRKTNHLRNNKKFRPTGSKRRK